MLVLVALLAAPGALTASAQQPLTLDSMTVRVWPEFDQPSALVFLTGTLPADAALPADVRVPVPAGAEINAVAYGSTGGGLFAADYEQQGDELVVTVEQNIVWVEFYDPSLTVDGDKRTYSLSVTPAYDVAQFFWEIQRPADAADLVVEPGGDGTFTTDSVGLLSYVVPAGAVSAGQTQSIDVSYTKPTDTLSVDMLPTPSAPLEQGAATDFEVAEDATAEAPATWLVIVLLAAGLALVAAGVWWYTTQMQSTRRPRRASAAPGGRAARSDRPASGKGKRFCTQCGATVSPSDTFCSKCGARL